MLWRCINILRFGENQILITKEKQIETENFVFRGFSARLLVLSPKSIDEPALVNESPPWIPNSYSGHLPVKASCWLLQRHLRVHLMTPGLLFSPPAHRSWRLAEVHISNVFISGAIATIRYRQKWKLNVLHILNINQHYELHTGCSWEMRFKLWWSSMSEVETCCRKSLIGTQHPATRASSPLLPGVCSQGDVVWCLIL